VDDVLDVELGVEIDAKLEFDLIDDFDDGETEAGI